LATDDDAAHVERQHGELDRRCRAVEALRLVVRRHKGADIAHQEQLAGSSAGQQVRHDARVAAAYEPRCRMLPFADKRAKLRLVLLERVVVKAA
jgi:hypothetical protein